MFKIFKKKPQQLEKKPLYKIPIQVRKQSLISEQLQRTTPVLGKLAQELWLE